MNSIYFSDIQAARIYFNCKDNHTVEKLGRGLETLVSMREADKCSCEEFSSLKPRELIKAVSQAAKGANLYKGQLDQLIRPLRGRIKEQIPGIQRKDLSDKEDLSATSSKGKEPADSPELSESFSEPSSGSDSKKLEKFEEGIVTMRKNLEKALKEHIDRAQSEGEGDIFSSSFDAPIDFNEKQPLQFQSGVHEAQSIRSKMEDKNFYKELAAGVLAAVLDGHGGAGVAEKASDLLQDNFQRIFDENKGDVHQTFNALFEYVDTEIEKDPNLNDQGTTAVVSFIDRKTHCIYTATLGDSEANIYRFIDGQLKSIPVSCVRDWSSKADIKRAALAIGMEREKAQEIIDGYLNDFRSKNKEAPEKILRLPAALIFPSQISYAYWGGPNVSRAIGDITDKKKNIWDPNKLYPCSPIGIKPKITVCQLMPDDLVILACDGLKDFVTESEIVETLSSMNDSSDLQETAKTLVELSTKKHRAGARFLGISEKGDNVTVSVLRVLGS